MVEQRDGRDGPHPVLLGFVEFLPVLGADVATAHESNQFAAHAGATDGSVVEGRSDDERQVRIHGTRMHGAGRPANGTDRECGRLETRTSLGRTGRRGVT
ncbi:hypothetical protein GCM10025780_10990 [Frondihabitans cladoniiphilus]|uniref:Uncharacterized protein n=1 Tax=Frondihabitans cladoniiphilus TaxID=715785 RepID=A0ABP8VR18_9MICO